MVALLPDLRWSSWNNFRINIDEEMIRQQADAMVDSGMTKAGYQYINIDDGYFGGRDSDGTLFSHPKHHGTSICGTVTAVVARPSTTSTSNKATVAKIQGGWNNMVYKGMPKI